MLLTIGLTGIHLEGFVGCLPEERINPVSIELDINMSVATEITDSQDSDKLENTLDYRLVLGEMKKTIKSRHFTTIENLSAVLGTNIFRMDSRIIRLKLRLKKLGVLPNGVVPWVETEVER
ncbi:MAG: dihydroneopterin aldolase [Deltaproteobacteria bacterium]|nr:dihydroneopterin aldolase [Deltaproteobacteria bacterium]